MIYLIDPKTVKVGAKCKPVACPQDWNWPLYGIPW
jgi:hypothetical protein